jgi:uncharacterized protein YjiS (DUF1127 family)
MFRNATLCLELPPDQPVGVRPRLTAVLARLRDWYSVYRQRRALLRLDDAMLKDIGISRVDALQEGNKPFWRS